MTARTLCQALSQQGHETIPPRSLAVLCAAQKLTLQRRRITFRNLMELAGMKHLNDVLCHVKKLRAAGLLRGEGWHQPGLAVACVFIPDEGR